MKKTLLVLALLLNISLISAQSNLEVINYQAVAISNGFTNVGNDIPGMPLANKNIKVKFSIIQGSAYGVLLYEETQETKTDNYGLFALNIGEGTVTSNGSYSSLPTLPWGDFDMFLKVEMDVNAGNNFVLSNIQLLTSVPYAMYATKANGLSNAAEQALVETVKERVSADYLDNDPTNELQELSLINNELSITGSDVVIDLSYISPTNGVNGNGITSTVNNNDGTYTFNYSDGSSFTTADLTGPQGVAGNDGAIGPQGLPGSAGATGNGITSTVNNNDGTYTFNYSDGSSFTTADLTGPQGLAGSAGAAGNGITSTVNNNDGTYTFNYSDGSSFTTADLGSFQNITLSGTNLVLSNGGFVDLSIINDGVDDPDNDPTNELQVLRKNEDTIFISNGNYILLSEVNNFNGVTSNFPIATYLKKYGDGRDGSFITSGNDVLSNESLSFTNFTVKQGHTLNLGSSNSGCAGKDYVIQVKDTCFIYGNIIGTGEDSGGGCKNDYNNSNIKYYEGRVSASGGQRGYSGTGGSGADIISRLVYNPNGNPVTYLEGDVGSVTVTKGQRMTSNLLNGIDGQSISEEKLLANTQLRPLISGIGGADNSCFPGKGGGPGVGLTIICRVLVFEGIINLSGGNGGNGCSSIVSIDGGAGGGGSGSLLISADNIIVNSGNVFTNGGIGGSGRSGGTSGGNGGNGSSVIIEY